MTYTWNKLVHESRQEDLVMYNSLFNFAKAEKGEILCVVCPIRKIGQYLIVENVGCNFAARNAAYFYEMRPVNIIGLYNHIVSSSWKGIQGMSGSPIFNSDGQIVSVYGLGKIENRSIESSNVSILSQPITALTVLAPECRANIVPENFFRTAVADLIDNELEEGNLYYLLEAPTGSGKTMSFTVNLMKSMGNNKKITLLQPTVAAVKSAFLRISELLDVEMAGANKYQILYTVGQQHEDSLDVRGNGSRKLHVMTYGTSLRHVREIEQTSNFVLLDEIHCRTDPTVVAGDLQFTKRASYKCVHLTATVLTRTRGQQLAVGLDISSTRFEIRENIRIEALNKNDKPDDSWLIIKSNVTGIRCEGFKLGYKIPMQVLRTGVVVFFLSTRHDCNALFNYCCRNYSSEGRQMVVIHGGTSFKVTDMHENCWCFCTDVVGQAVTIPGCRVVVDFLEEMKPSTIMYANNEGLIYKHTLIRRRIGLATSKQRKGRTGRTNTGWYITPRGLNPVQDHPIDSRTVAVAMLELEAEKRFDFERIEREHHNQQLVGAIRELLWIMPSKIVSQRWHMNMIEGLKKNDKVYVSLGKNFLCDSYSRKLEVVRRANGDLVYLYLTPIISEELMHHTMANKEKLARLAEGTDASWYNDMFDFCYKTKTEEDRQQALLSVDCQISSYKESVRIPEEVSFEVYNRVFSSEIGSSDEVFHSAMGAVSGAAVAIGASAVLLGSVYHLTIKNIDRYVTKLYVFRNKFAASHCKYLAASEKDKQSLIESNFAKLAWKTASDRIGKTKDWFVSNKFPVSTEEHSSTLPGLSAIMATAKDFLMNKWVLIPASYHVGAFPSLASVMTAGWIGSVFPRLENVLGRSLAVVVLAMLNGICTHFVPFPLAVTCCVAQIIGFVMRGLVDGKIKEYGMYGEAISSSDRAWDMVFGIAAGVGVGYLIKNQLFVTAHLAASGGFLHSTGGTAMGVVGGRSAMLGNLGNSTVLVKQVYLLFTRVQDGKLSWDSVGAMLTTLIQTVNLDITTGILCALVSVALIAIRSGLKLMKYQAGISVKTVRPVDGTNTYVEDFFGSYDNFALTVLSSASVLASPSSMISVIIAWIANCSRRGEVTRGCFKDAFEAYSGVPIAIAIISEGINALASSDHGVERHSMSLSTILCSIPSMLAGVVGCVYYLNNSDAVHAISNVWKNVKQFAEFLWKFMRDSISGVASFIGSSIGDGMVSKIFESAPSWMKAKVDNLVLEEKFAMKRAEPQIINEWFSNRVSEGKVSLIERLHYSRSIFDQERYGSVLPVNFLKFVKEQNQGLSICRKYTSSVPFEFFCVTANDLYSIVSCFAGEVEVSLSTIIIERGSCKVTLELGYRGNVATHYINVVKGSIGMTFLIISRPNNCGGSLNYVLGWRVPSGLTSTLFSKLACLHPAISALSGGYEELQPSVMELETSDVCAWGSHGVVLSWQRAITSVVVGAVDCAVSLFGLISKVQENTFDLGLIPVEWCQRPDELTGDEWELYQWLLWSRFESGILIDHTVKQLARSKHLPMQVLSCCTQKWRRIHKINTFDVSRIKKIIGPVVRLCRKSDNSDPGYRRNTSFEGVFSLNAGLNATDQWLHAAWWAGINVYYEMNESLHLSTVGGYCTCSVFLNVKSNNTVIMGFCPCDRHVDSWVVEEIEVPPEPIEEYLSLSTDDDTVLTQKLNKILGGWYSVDPWRRSLGVKNKVTQAKVNEKNAQCSKSWFESIKSKVWATNPVALEQHSSNIMTDLVSAMENLYVMFNSKRGVDNRTLIKKILDDWGSATVSSSLDEEQEKIEADIVIEDKEGEVFGRFRHLLGFDKPNVSVAPYWAWLKDDTNIPVRDGVTISSVIKAGINTNKLASRLTKPEWLKFEKLTRVSLPKRTSEIGSYVSRGGPKMQQLHEADPQFFEDLKLILDPCAGFGGFAEYYSSVMKSKAPKTYIASSLIEKGHRIPSGDLRMAEGSNVNVILATNPLHEDKGNIKDPRTIARLANVVRQCGDLDLLIVDAGEYSADGVKNRNFWYKKGRKGFSFLDGVMQLLKLLRKGAKACFKINGPWHGLLSAVRISRTRRWTWSRLLDGSLARRDFLNRVPE